MSKNETRMRIVDTAIDLFWKASYHGTNMNDLSREAGVNKATVYQYFRSKEELAEAAIERAAERTVDYVFTSTFEEFDQPLDRLRGIHRRVYETHRIIYDEMEAARGCPFVNIGMELAATNDNIRSAVQSAFKKFVAFYLQIVEQLESQNMLQHNVEPEQLARDLQDNMNASLITSKIEDRPAAILEGGERAIRYLIG